MAAPEAKARENIDRMLVEAGYVLQDMDEFNRNAALGVAVREYPTEPKGSIDYLLFVGGTPAGLIEAKREDQGAVLLTVAEQTERYLAGGLKHMEMRVADLRFVYESTGVRTLFRDTHDEKPRSREVYSFHRPETLEEWLKDESTLRNRLINLPPLQTQGFRNCQVVAIQKLEKSFAANKPRALIQMATGAGKTFTAITSVYRLLKHAKARRVLFLVDTKNLGEQAEAEFSNYKPYDDCGRLFPELYNVRRLNSSHIPPETKVCISTIQRMYSILRGEELDESVEEESPNEQNIVGRPRDVVYHKCYTPEFFDFIIIDECHRSIYNIWQQVLDYFDAFLIGLTATPDYRTFAFFHENVVSEYTHEQAVLDNVNVGREGTYLIETQIGSKGGVILKQTVEVRERLSRKKRWEQLDEDIDYTPSQLDHDIVNLSQIRCVIKAFHEAWPTIFYDRKELPKTLIFAKTDSHADDIINIIREEFGKGNDFCKKVTYAAKDPKSVLTDFRKEYNPRIAVTVDMIATGTDVKPIECLVFMRDVRSKNYFEQMLGRATRTLDYDDLNRVSPSAVQRKLGYVVVDAVGVTKSQKTASRQLERKPTTSLKDLMMSVATGAHDEDTLTTLAGRLAGLDKVMTQKEKETFSKICNNPVISIAANMLNAFDEDKIDDAVREKYGKMIPENKRQKYSAEVSKEMAIAASAPFNIPEVRNYIENIRKSHFQIIDKDNIDHTTYVGWDTDQAQYANETIGAFAKFIEENRNTIDALKIIYSQSYKNRQLTLEMIKELHTALCAANLSPERVWKAYTVCQAEKIREKNVVAKLADIISLVRFQLGQTAELNPFSSNVARRFKEWTFDKQKGAFKFTEEQAAWLRMLRDHIATSVSVTTEDLNLLPFDSKGGLGKFYELFGTEYENILAEMNYALLVA